MVKLYGELWRYILESKNLLKKLGFLPKENTVGIYEKQYQQHNNYAIKIDFTKEIISYGKLISSESKTTQNFSQSENWVILECVDRLLTKGYKPQNIILEKTWGAGHGTSGRLDICVTREDGSEYLLIECKTYGKEFEKEFNRMNKDGGQLFTYFKFSNKADVIMLYSSTLKGQDIVYENQIIKIEDDYRTGDVKDFYDKWNKLTKDNGVFESWVKPYCFESKALIKSQLKPITQEDSSFIFNRFLEILRHNVVSDKGNAFNKIFTLFLCKVYDETSARDDEELKFQWLEGIDDDVSFQLRLTDLYKKGMLQFLSREVSDFDEDDFNKRYKNLSEDDKKTLLVEIHKLRLEKNNEFAIKEVYDHQSFKENAKIVKEVVELLQGFRIRYNKRQQYLSDFFELLLTTGLKQESGQFFTPVPIAQFIIKSLPLEHIVNDKLKQKDGELLPFMIDYAAGSGHFITEYMHEVQSIINNKKSKEYIDATAKKLKNWQEDHFDWATKYVYGIEKDYRLVKVGKVGCYLHGDGLANVILSDGLGSFVGTKDYKGKLLKNKEDDSKDHQQFDILLSNPPYSVSSFKQTTREYYTENDFELYNKLTDNSSEIECLFIERTKQLLKDGGVAGIILPSSILSNAGIYTKAREMILQYFDIVAVAELGSNTFMATGTNTVVLFLRRKNNYECINLKKSVGKFFANFSDVTLNGIEKPVSKYVNYVWEDISFEDYITLLQKEPNKSVKENELYKEYRKKIKAKTDKDFFNIVLECEKEKLYYFILAYSQKTVLVKTGEKDAEKRFLGYEFSNRRGNEGIHPIQRNKSIDECTRLFDTNNFDNPEKASTYIYKAFMNDFDFPIDETLSDNISRVSLIDLITFDRVDFEKIINLNSKKKIKIESKWNVVRLENHVTLLKRGKSPKYSEQSEVQIIKSGQIRGLKNFDFSKKYYASSSMAIDERLLQKGDLLINSTGVGTAGRVNLFELGGNYFVDSHVAICRLNQEKLLPHYVLYHLYCNIGFKNIEKMSTGQSGQIELSPDTIAHIKIPIPPLDIQERIIAEIEAIEEQENKVRMNIDKYKQQNVNILNNINSLKKYNLETVAENLDYLRKPITKGYRENGTIPYYGASGVIDYVSDYILDDYVLLVAEDGANLKSRTQPIAFTAEGKTWVNNHAHILKFKDCCTHKLIEYYLNNTEISEYITGQAQPKLNQTNLSRIKVPVPSIKEQQKIVTEIEKLEQQISEAQKFVDSADEIKREILKKYL